MRTRLVTTIAAIALVLSLAACDQHQDIVIHPTPTDDVAMPAKTAAGTSHGVLLGAVSQAFVDSTNGSDSNDCASASTPCATVAHALTVSGNVLFAPGAYHEQISLTTPITFKNLTI